MTQSLSILLVEDEPLILMMMEDILDTLDHRVVATADSVADALQLVEQGGFDVAILDVKLMDGACWPVADKLQDEGKPYLLATGGHVEPPPARHADVPQLTKPFTFDGLRGVLDSVSGLT